MVVRSQCILQVSTVAHGGQITMHSTSQHSIIPPVNTVPNGGQTIVHSTSQHCRKSSLHSNEHVFGGILRKRAPVVNRFLSYRWTQSAHLFTNNARKNNNKNRKIENNFATQSILFSKEHVWWAIAQTQSPPLEDFFYCQIQSPHPFTNKFRQKTHEKNKQITSNQRRDTTDSLLK